MSRIYSYVVRYDSGFAPNPFYGYCTLATCKPDIRRTAEIGDLIVGCGSNDRAIRRGGHLVYIMKVTETMTFEAYSADERFEAKKPFRRGSRKQSCGDNIYFRDPAAGAWCQLDSFHSRENGTLQPQHVERDTGVNRVLISNDFVYFGGEGGSFPKSLCDNEGRSLCKSGRGMSCFDDPRLLQKLENWMRGFGVTGYQGAPQEWISLRG
ncbi:MAG TPA: hypothetical protein VM659_13065 [Dongiaceae bacterium]|nr:hypothetical protein [Dongiaceae bacterium]